MNLLVDTYGAVALGGHDIRRLRPNLVLSGVLAEMDPDLPGQAFVIGDAVIGVQLQRQGRIVTSIDPDSGEQNLDVFRRVRNVFGGQLALNCWMIRPGVVHIDDLVSIGPAPGRPTQIGGWIVGAPFTHHTRSILCRGLSGSRRALKRRRGRRA